MNETKNGVQQVIPPHVTILLQPTGELQIETNVDNPALVNLWLDMAKQATIQKALAPPTSRLVPGPAGGIPGIR